MILFQPILTRHNGIRLIKFFVLLIFSVMIFGGCSEFWDPGEGRGDWSVQLYSGYKITKVNSKGVRIYGNDSFAVKNYFVNGVQAKEPYVCFRGIPTVDRWISDDELTKNETVYYLLNTDTDALAGPFETFEELRVHCETVSVIVKDQWIDIDRKSSTPPELRDTGMVVRQDTAETSPTETAGVAAGSQGTSQGDGLGQGDGSLVP